jgi:hypothetical protein
MFAIENTYLQTPNTYILLVYPPCAAREVSIAMFSVSRIADAP